MRSIIMSTTDGVRFSRVVTDAVGWGVALWLIGYILGIILFFFLPTPVIGWLIMPVGVVITLWVLLNKINNGTVWQYAALSIAWTLIAVAFDNVFIVRAFSPIDGYYKLDVYLYYTLTFSLPLAVGWWRSSSPWRLRRENRPSISARAR
jgi:hypothetical protein